MIIIIILQPYPQGPFKGTVFYGIVSTLFVAVFVIDELIDMLSIGTLIAYMMASISIIRLRYKPLAGDYQNGNSESKCITVTVVLSWGQ